MKSILIITKAQFGYHTDTFKYCQHLKNDFLITFYCFDHGFKKKSISGIKVIYVSPTGNIIKRGANFFLKLKDIQKDPWDIVFVKNFDFCFIVKYMIQADNFVLDLRTGSVAETKIKRVRVNFKTRINTWFFKKYTVISIGLAQKFNLKNYFVLPLGADIISHSVKSFDSIRVLYVGTFDHRNIHETVIGFAKFARRFRDIQLSYDIVGFGSKHDTKLIMKSIDDNKINDLVKYHGRKTHDELKDFFDNCNVGVSYVPIKPYYEYQPVTKTFEYIYSGLICIGTDTQENAKVINEINGVLCSDNAESFYKSMVTILNNIKHYDSDLVRKSLGESNKWNYICQKQFKPYLLNLK